MDPHTLLVEKLFRAANKMKGFKSFSAYFFHNVPYGMLTRMQDGREERVPIPRLLNEWTQAHRLVFVGDASMAPYELFASMGISRWQDSSGRERSSGLDWLKMIRRSCPASIWMNPDPMRWWDHQTVAAIGQVYPMFPLTVDGLRDGIRELRKMES